MIITALLVTVILIAQLAFGISMSFIARRWPMAGVIVWGGLSVWNCALTVYWFFRHNWTGTGFAIVGAVICAWIAWDCWNKRRKRRAPGWAGAKSRALIERLIIRQREAEQRA